MQVNCIHERIRVELTSALYSFWKASCCASLMKLKLWLVISPVLLWFFSRELILSLKATFSHEATQGTPAKLIILLRAVHTPLRLGWINAVIHVSGLQDRLNCFWVALFVFLCMFLWNEFCLVRERADPKDKVLELIPVCWSWLI